jgi:hypothetical protein
LLSNATCTALQFGYDKAFMDDMAANPELRKKMLTNSFAAVGRCTLTPPDPQLKGA